VEAVKRNAEQVYRETIERVKSSKKVSIEEKIDRLDEELLEGTIDRSI